MEYAGSLKFDTKIDSKGFDKGLSKLGSVAKSGAKIATAAIGTVSAALAAASVAAYKFGTDYENSLAKVSTIADTAKKPLATLSKEMIELSNATGMAGTELNEALYQAISAGADTANATGLVATAVKAAKGGFTDTATAVDGLTSVLNTYGMETSAADALANEFLITQNKGKTTFGELAQSIGLVAPVAKSTGLSTRELLSSVAALTANGLGTSEAVTSMKAALSNVIKPSSDAAKAAAQLGLDFNVAAIKSKGFAAWMQEIKNKAGGNTEVMSQLFGSVEGLNAMLTLASDEGMQLMNETMSEMSSNTTALEDAFEAMNNTTSANVRKIGNYFKNLGIALYEDSSGAISQTVSLFAGMAQRLYTAFEEGGTENLVTALGDVVSEMITSAAKAAPGMVDTAVKFIDAFVEGIEKNAGEIAKAGEDILKAFARGIAKLAPKLFDAALRSVEAFAKGVEKYAPRVGAYALNIVQALVNGVAGLLPKLMASGASVVRGLAEGIAGALPGLVNSIVDGVLDTVGALLDLTADFSLAGSGLMDALLDGLMEGVQKIAQRLPELLLKAVKGNFENLAKSVFTIYDTLKAAAGNWLENTSNQIDSMIGIVNPAYKKVKDAEKEAARQIQQDMEENKRKTQEFTDSVETLAAENKKYNQSIKEGQQKRKAALPEIEKERAVTKRLTDELYNLSDKQNKTLSEKARMKKLVDQLNDTLPDLKLNFNEETGALNKTRDAVYEAVEAKKKLALQDAAQGMMTQAYTDRYTSQIKLNELYQKRLELVDKLNSYKGNDTDAEWQNIHTALAETETQIKDTAGTLKSSEDEISYAMRLIDQSVSETAANTQLGFADIKTAIVNSMKDAPQTLQGMKDGLAEFGKTMLGNAAQYGYSLPLAWQQALETAQPETFDSVDTFMQYVLSLMDQSDAAKILGGSTSDAWKDGLIEQAVASQGDLSAVASQVGGEYLTQYLQAMIRNKPELSAGINALLKEAGLDALPTAAETGNETGTELVDAAQKAVKQGDIGFIGPVQKAGTEAKKEASGGGTHTAEEFLDAAKKGAKNGGTQLSGAFGAVVADASSQEAAAQTGADVTANAFGDEAKNEIAGQEQKVQGAVSELMNAVSTGGEGADQKAVEVGQAMQEKISEGLTGRQDELKNSVITVTKNASDGAKDSARSGAIPVGNEMAEGIRIGITEKAVTMNESLKTAVRDAIDAGRKEAEIRSPSRVTRDRIGKPLVDGIAVGILQNGEASEAMEQVIADLELQRDLGLIGDAEYYAGMERYRDEYLTKGTKEWWEYTKQILQYRADSLTAGFDLTEEADKKELERLSRSGNLTLEEEARVLRDRAARNRVFAEEVLTLEGITQEKKRELHEKYLDAAEQAELEALEVQTQIYDKEAEAFEEKLGREETLFAFRKKMSGVAFEEEQGYLKARSLKYRDFAADVLEMEAYTQEQRAKLHQEYLDKAEDAERTYLENQRDRLDLVAEQLKGIMPFSQKATIKEGGIKPEYELKNGVWRNKYEAAESAFLPPDYAAMSAEIDRYTALMEQLRRRMNEAGGKLSEDFYTELSGLSVQDATQLLSMLVKQSDAQFEAFAKFQAQRNALADQGAADILGIDLAAYQSGLKAALEGNSLDLSPEGLGADMAEAEAAFEDTGKSLKEKLLEHFKNVPESFLDIGVDAAESFADGFAQKLEAVKLQIQSVVAGIMPTAAAGAGAGNVQNISNAVSYNLYGSGETVAQQLQSARAHRQLEKLRGNL